MRKCICSQNLCFLRTFEYLSYCKDNHTLMIPYVLRGVGWGGMCVCTIMCMRDVSVSCGFQTTLWYRLLSSLKSELEVAFYPYSHRNHYFNQYHWNATPENKKLFCHSRNHCRESSKMRDPIIPKQLGSRDFRRICNSILNRGSHPYLLFLMAQWSWQHLMTKLTSARNFSCNSILDDGSQQLPYFPSRTEQRVSSQNITAKMVSHAIYDLDASKATGPTEFQPLSLRCVLQSFLLLLLSYKINDWLNLVFLPVGNLHWLCQFLKMMERDLIQVSIVL